MTTRSPTDLQSHQPVTILEAVGVYVRSFKKKDRNSSAQQELLRFANWCGADKVITNIGPPEIGAYGEQAVGVIGGSHVAERLQEVRKFLSFVRKKGLIEQNLASHLRIRKTQTRGRRDQQDNQQNRIELTPDGHRKLTVDLEKLIAQRVPLAAVIRQAAADKDVRENTPLEAAREQLGYVESRITEIEVKLRSVVVVARSKRRGKAIEVGSTVVLKDLSAGRQTKYTVVTAFEAAPLEGKISNVSPVGQELLGRTAGQEIEVATPRGPLGYRIVRVSS